MTARRRSFTARLICLVAFLIGQGGVARAAGEYRTVDTEGLKIVLDSEWAGRTTPGYIPVRIEITNTRDARVIDIVAQGTRFISGSRGGARGTTAMRQTLRLARGDRVRLTVPVPVFANNESIRFEIQEDGRTLERFNHTGFQSRMPRNEAAALIVADPSSPLGSAATGWRRMVKVPSSGTAGRAAPALDFVLDPVRLPASWLGYTSLRAVFIGPTEWQQLTDAQRDALLTWTACGGDLMFVGGDLDALLPGTQTLASAGSNPHVRAYFFGRIHVRSVESVSTAGLATVLSDAQKLQDTTWSLPINGANDWSAITARGFRLPIPDVAGIPARAYLSILVLFTLLIGPANYWFLRRRRQQVLLVLTTPLIAILFIGVLAAYVVAGEGVGVHGRAVTFTMLDQARRQASTRASVSMYAAGMTPAGGLRFARDEAIFPIGRDGFGTRDALTLDLTDGQRFSDGVIQARSATNFEEITFRSARERLTFTREGGGISVVNGLGVTIPSLLYHDGTQVYSLASPLAAGAKGTLTPGGVDARRFVPADVPQSPRFRHLVENQPAGSYLAVLDRSPFWNAGVANLGERGSFHLVIGWPEGQP